MLKSISFISIILMLIGCGSILAEPENEPQANEMGNSSTTSSSSIQALSSSTPIVNVLDTALLASQWQSLLEANIPISRTYIKKDISTSSFMLHEGDTTEIRFTIVSSTGTNLSIDEHEYRRWQPLKNIEGVAIPTDTIAQSDTSYTIEAISFWQNLVGHQRPPFQIIKLENDSYSISTSSSQWMGRYKNTDENTLLLDLNFWPVSSIGKEFSFMPTSVSTRYYLLTFE